MKNLLMTVVCLVGGLLLVPAAQAADSGEQPRQYDIELLVFRNLVDNDGGEVWPVDYSTWYNEASDNAQPLAEAQPVQWLPESGSHLRAERASLDRSSRYRTVAYLAWRQPVYDRGRARPVELPVRPRSDAAWVDGSVSVAVERYLHLSLDLQLHLPAPTGSSVAGDATEQPQLPEIRLTEQRRMRSRELHYFDNPRFGVIALITPYEAPAASADDNVAPDTAGTAPAAGASPGP